MEIKENFNPKRPYCRKEIDDAFNKRKALMQKEALQRGLAYDNQNIALYHDCYTGKMLRGGDRYNYEHIISAQAVFEHYKATHSNEQIAQIVNLPDNVSVTLRTINQNKGKYDLQNRILNNPTKIKEFDIDVVVAKQNFENAKKAVLNLNKTIIN